MLLLLPTLRRLARSWAQGLGFPDVSKITLRGQDSHRVFCQGCCSCLRFQGGYDMRSTWRCGPVWFVDTGKLFKFTTIWKSKIVYWKIHLVQWFSHSTSIRFGASPRFSHDFQIFFQYYISVISSHASYRGYGPRPIPTPLFSAAQLVLFALAWVTLDAGLCVPVLPVAVASQVAPSMHVVARAGTELGGVFADFEAFDPRH